MKNLVLQAVTLVTVVLGITIGVCLESAGMRAWSLIPYIPACGTLLFLILTNRHIS